MLTFEEGLLYLFRDYQAEVGLTAALHAFGVADTDIRVSAENVDTQKEEARAVLNMF